MTPTKRRELILIRTWCDDLLAADAALAEPEPEQPEAVDLAAWRTSVRNRVLAGAGEKTALLGTLSTEPTVTAADIDAALGKGTAAERDRLRAAALALKVDAEIMER